MCIQSTYALGGREGSFGSPGSSSVVVGAREGRGGLFSDWTGAGEKLGGGARLYLYTVLGAFMFNSTGRRPVSVCVCVCVCVCLCVLCVCHYMYVIGIFKFM